MIAGCCCAETCTAAVLIGVMRFSAAGSPFDNAWCLVCEVWRLTVDWVDCRCLLSFVFLGGARRLMLSPCNTLACTRANAQAVTTVRLVCPNRTARTFFFFVLKCRGIQETAHGHVPTNTAGSILFKYLHVLLHRRLSWKFPKHCSTS